MTYKPVSIKELLFHKPGLVLLHANQKSKSYISKKTGTYPWVNTILQIFQQEQLITITKKGRETIITRTTKGDLIANKILNIKHALEDHSWDSSIIPPKQNS